MRRLRLLTVLFVLAAGCHQIGGPKLYIEADKTEIPAGGNDYVTITVTLKYGDSPGKNKEIQFTTTMGSFSDTDPDMKETSVSTDDNGQASVKLWSGREQGTASVTASFTDPDSGETVERSITVVFGEPSLSSLPISSKFQLTCDYLNVPALVNPKPDIWVPCSLTAKNVRDEVIPVESLKLMYYAEAGVLEGWVDEYDGYKLYYKVRGGNDYPQDVDPLPGMEPSRECGSMNSVCNPRDGLVTLMVVTRGAEAFVDTNGNGKWDEGEQFEDLPEPFLDTNDNGKYDKGEPFFDANGDQKFTNGNGKYDADTYIWATAKILWTGDVAEEPGAAEITTEPEDVSNLPNDSTIKMFVKLVDKNLNPIAAFEPQGDILLMEADQGLIPAHGGEFRLKNVTGITMDSEGRILDIDADVANYMETFKDADTNSTEPVSFMLTVRLQRSIGPIGEEQDFQQSEYVFDTVITGQIQ